MTNEKLFYLMTVATMSLKKMNSAPGSMFQIFMRQIIGNIAILIHGISISCVLLCCVTPAQGQIPSALGPSFNCNEATAWVEQLICKTPALAEADQKLADAYKGAMERAAEYDKKVESTDNVSGDRQKSSSRMIDNVRTSEREWLSARSLVCKGAAPNTDEDERTCVAALKRAYDTRVQVFSSSPWGTEESERRIGAQMEALRFPENWWGWSTRTHGSDRGAIFNLLAGPEGSLYALEIWGKANKNFAIVNVVTGAEIASTLTDAKVLSNNGVRDATYARLGIKWIPYPFNGISGRNGSLKSVQNSPPHCGSPNALALSYELNGHLVSSFYFFKWLSRAVTYPEDALCEETWASDNKQDRTLNYETLWPTPLGELSDHSFLVLIGDVGVVRFKADLSSPFFSGKSDLIFAQGKDVEGIIGGHLSPAGKIRAVRDLLVNLSVDQKGATTPTNMGK